jgi:hypothetical protein
MQLLKLLVVGGEGFPSLALSQWFRACFHTCDAFVSLLGWTAFLCLDVIAVF